MLLDLDAADDLPELPEPELTVPDDLPWLFELLAAGDLLWLFELLAADDLPLLFELFDADDWSELPLETDDLPLPEDTVERLLLLTVELFCLPEFEEELLRDIVDVRLLPDSFEEFVNTDSRPDLPEGLFTSACLL